MKYGFLNLKCISHLYERTQNISKSHTIWQSCPTILPTQFPSHGLGEPMAYGFQTLAYSVAVNIMKFYRHDQDSNPDLCSENQRC